MPLKQAVQKKEVTQNLKEQLISRLDELPVLPQVARQVNTLIQDPKSNSQDIAKVLMQDQALTSKVLKLVNSPYYGLSNPVSDVGRAITYLGQNTIAQLALSLSVFSVFTVKSDGLFSVSKFWAHTLAVAVCSRFIAQRLKYKNAEEAFCAGLMHDIGKLALLKLFPNEFMEIVQNAFDQKKTFSESESELYSIQHAELGSLVAAKWRFPQNIQDTILKHHELNSKNTELSLIVSFSNLFIGFLGVGHSGGNKKVLIHDADLNLVQLKLSDLEQLKTAVMSEIQKASKALGVNI